MFFRIRDLVVQTSTHPLTQLPCIQFGIAENDDGPLKTATNLDLDAAQTLVNILNRFDYGSTEIKVDFTFSNIRIQIAWAIHDPVTALTVSFSPAGQPPERMSMLELQTLASALSGMVGHLTELQNSRREAQRNMSTVEMIQGVLPHFAKLVERRRRRDDDDDEG